MEQIKNINLKSLDKNLIYPIYLEQEINVQITDTLNCNLNSIINKEYLKTTTIHTLNNFNFDTITFISLGSKDKVTTQTIRDVAKKIKTDKPSVIYLEEIETSKLDINTITTTFIESYLIEAYQEQKIGHEPHKISPIDIIYSQNDLKEAINKGINLGNGINYARKISDLPSNLMTPYDLVKEAKKLAQQYNMECTILDKDDLEKMNAGGILSVNKGSDIPAYLICLKYTNGTGPYSAVIGKGITFDSGGYNIKKNSYGMKYDMCGGGDVLGIMQILAANHVKANVYGIIPTTENLINGGAYKPQDVITTLAKKTVEIVSTDAEGRLILADAITYAQQLGATKLIDLATLTGACVAALGDLYTGVFSNDDDFYEKFAQCAKQSDEKAWRLPIAKEYFHKLKSNSADFKNSVGKPGAGASVAANFLAAFVNDDVKWIHLDIAGTADNDGTGATGAMIRSVVNFIAAN